MMKVPYAAILAIAVMFLFGCLSSPEAPPAPQPAPPAPQEEPEQPNPTLANPASVNCVDKGYKLEIRTADDGSQTGVCIFPNGNECEEWAFFRGECDENGAVRKGATEGEFCGGIAGLPCEEGLSCKLDGSYPDAGGRCEKPLEPKFIECTGERGNACTMEYLPVCGRSGDQPSLYAYKEYGNGCVACSKGSPALGYYVGACKDNGFTILDERQKDVFYTCPEVRGEACTKEYDPVCGRAVDASSSIVYFNDYGNPCVACSKASNAVGYYIGTCASRGN